LTETPNPEVALSGVKEYMMSTVPAAASGTAMGLLLPAAMAPDGAWKVACARAAPSRVRPDETAACEAGPSPPLPEGELEPTAPAGGGPHVAQLGVLRRERGDQLLGLRVPPQVAHQRDRGGARCHPAGRDHAAAVRVGVGAVAAGGGPAVGAGDGELQVRGDRHDLLR
jgi:hypothetical protein